MHFVWFHVGLGPQQVLTPFHFFRYILKMGQSLKRHSIWSYLVYFYEYYAISQSQIDEIRLSCAAADVIDDDDTLKITHLNFH